MSEAKSIEARFHADGWITDRSNGVSVLAFKTERLIVHLTNLSAAGLPTSDRDWLINYLDAETGETHSHSQETADYRETIDDAIAGLPAYGLVCTECGSDDVVTDAVGRWNADRACWELSSIFDDKSCCSCGADGHGILKAILPRPNLLCTDAAA